MKVLSLKSESNFQFKIDGTHEIVVQFEEGDVFINSDNCVVMLSSLIDGCAVIHTNTENVRTTLKNFPSDEWLSKWRFCGVYDDEELTGWDDSLDLSNT